MHPLESCRRLLFRSSLEAALAVDAILCPRHGFQAL